MTKQLVFADVDMNGLHDDLIAAGIAPLYVGGVYDPKVKAEVAGAVRIHVGDDVDEQLVADVAKRHDREAAGRRRAAAAQSAADDDATVATVLAEVEAALTATPARGAETQRVILRSLGVLLRRERRRQGA